MTNQLLLPCFFSGWGEFCLRSSKSPALTVSTERVIHFKTLIQFYQQNFSHFFSLFSSLVIKQGGLSRKSAQKQHLWSHSWGESKDCAKQGTARERKSEQVQQGLPARCPHWTTALQPTTTRRTVIARAKEAQPRAKRWRTWGCRTGLEYKHHKIRCAACKCWYFQTKALPHTWVSNGPSTSLPPSTPAGANHSQHLSRSRNLFFYVSLIHLYFSMSANFSTCRPPCSPWLTHPHVAVYTALVFGNRHLLTSFHYSDTLPTTCLRISCWELFSF